MSSQENNETGIRQLGPYRIVRTLGHGGMGTVYEGVNTETDEPAAVKVLAAALAEKEGFRQRFETEIETLRKLRHPNIVRLFGFGEHQGVLFYGMELVDGRSLEEELLSGRRFEWRQVAEIGIEVCRALKHAHDRGVVHRDLKPANLLLAADGTVRLLDFGIAKLFGYERLTVAGSVLGTIEYMAPEQADALPAGPRADLYSLGGVFYALLAGRPPFRAKSLAEMVQKQTSTVPEPVSRYCADVPAEMEAMIGQLLEKAPEKRIANATLLARRLESLLSAPPPATMSLRESDSEDQGDFELGPVRPKSDRRKVEELPETRAKKEADPPPPGQRRAAGLDDALMPTKATSAFDALDSDAQEPFQSQPRVSSTLRPAETSSPANRFTPIAEEDLDRFDTEEPVALVLISPQTWALVAGLISVALVTWYLLRPPDAETLYRRITKVTAEGTVDSYRRAEDDIRKFLMGHSADSRAEVLRQYLVEIELDRRENRFELRFSRQLSVDKLLPIERDYLEAIKYVRLDPERGMVRLKALCDLYGRRGGMSRAFDTSGPTGQCLELARRRWLRLREQLQEYADRRVPSIHVQLDHADKVDRADDVDDADPDRAREIRRAVIELYGEKPWAQEVVRRARAALAADSGDLDEPGELLP